MGSCMSAVALVAMITTECTDVGMSTLTKAAMSEGMSSFVIPVYYGALATLILLPFVVFIKRGAPLTFSLLLRFFLISLIGSLSQVTSFTALKYSSPTLSSALANLIPIFTFLLAITFRIEKVDIRSSSGVAICLGALISVSGAFIITLYKGPQILKSSSSSSLIYDFTLHESQQQSNWVLGGIFMAITCLSTAIWSIFTAAIVKEFPEKMTIVFFYSLFTTIFCGIFSLIAERNISAWAFTSDIQIIAILYAAVFGSVFRNSVHMWCFKDKGPIYVTIFKPLGISIAMLMGVLLLGESLYAGSIIGAVIVTLGFYTVMWGKSKEQSFILKNEVDDLESSSQRTPLLQGNTKEEI